MIKAQEIAKKAVEILDERAGTHGDKLVNHQAIASIWNGYLLARIVSGKPDKLSAIDVANMMELLKVARRLNGGANIDDAVDGAGYAAIAGEFQSLSSGQTAG